MKRSRIIVAAVLAAIVVAGVGIAWLHPREPAYQGRRLGTWLQEVGSSNAATAYQAKQAVISIGTNGLPAMIRMLGRRDSFLEERLRQLSLRYRLIQRFYDPKSDLSWSSCMGFRILGSRAEPAVPQLIEMLGTEDDLIRSRVATSLEGIGPIAFPELLEAFRTRTGRVSSGAATVLNSIDLERAVKAGVK